MNSCIRVFSYGFDLDLSVLHTIIGGPKPICDGLVELSGFSRTFGVSGHLPGLVAKEDGSVSGALTMVTAEQLQRMDAWLLPYKRWRMATSRCSGLLGQAWVYLPVVVLHEYGRPSLATLQTLCRGAVDRGLNDQSIQQLMGWLPCQQNQLLQAMGKNLVFSV